jgi:hypothetical protein
MGRDLRGATAYLPKQPAKLPLSQGEGPRFIPEADTTTTFRVGSEAARLEGRSRRLWSWRSEHASAIVLAPMTQGRIDKTRDKMRRGGLPASTSDPPAIRMSVGNRCSGCDELIETGEEEYFVNVVGVVLLRLHRYCYDAWATFRRSP